MASNSDEAIEQPTRVRWLMFLLACGTSWFLYLHRYSWNIVEPKIQEMYQLNNTQSGLVFAFFYWTYAAGQIPSGTVIDWFGPHLFLGVSVILWSIAVIGFARSGNLWGIYGLRFLFGAAQAGCYPGLNKATRVWFPLRTRTTVQGWVATAFGRGGGAMSPIIMGTLLMGYCGLSWQLSLTMMGLAGVVFGLLFLILFRNSPDVHPGVNNQERLLISEGGSTVSVSATLPWSKALRNRSLFFFTLQQFMDAGSDVVFVSLIGKYFLARHGLDIKSVGWLASLPLWGGALGGIVGGWLNDRMILATGNRRWSRSGIGFVGKLIGCLMLYVVSSQNAPVAAGLALMFAKFFSDWSQPTVWGTCTDLGGRCSATVFSIINTAGTVAGGILPVLFGRLLDLNTTRQIVDGVTIKHTDWGPLFLVLASMYLASGIFWLLIDCTKPIDPEAAATPA